MARGRGEFHRAQRTQPPHRGREHEAHGVGAEGEGALEEGGREGVVDGEADLRAEREHTLHLTRVTRRDQADLESLAEQLGQAWDARDSARRVAVTLENENRCAIDLLRMVHGTLAKIADDPPDNYTRQDADLHYWIGAFLRTQGVVPSEDTAKAAG